MIFPQIIRDREELFFQHRLIQMVILVTGYWLLVRGCFAQSVSSSELLRNPKEYDGKKIIYQGEIIGDVMRRKDFIWVNLKDRDLAVGVYLPKEIFPSPKYVGSYKASGDILEVEGIFHHHCLEHGGDMDIHAEKIKVIREGFLRKEEFFPLRKLWVKRLAISGFFLFFCILLRDLWKRVKRKAK